MLKQISDRENLILTDADVSILITDWADWVKGKLLKLDPWPPGGPDLHLRDSADEFEIALLRLSWRRRAECFRDAVRSSHVVKEFTASGRIAEGQPQEEVDGRPSKL